MHINNVKTKKCTKCKQILTVDNFYKQKSIYDGLNVLCKDCIDIFNKKYYENNKEEISLYMKEYRKIHKEELKAHEKKYRFEHVDGIRLEAHNLVGQLLGETGIVGGVAFILMVIVTLLNCRKVRVPGRGQSNATIKALSSLGPACRDAVILLAFEGLFGHNLLRFNWLWLAAFSSLALQFARKHIKEPISTKGL